MMKKEYAEPLCRIIALASADLLTASGGAYAEDLDDIAVNIFGV